MEQKYAVLSLSGGMDSSTLLIDLLSQGYNITALSFDYGQKHKVELERAKDLVMYLNQQSGSNALIKPITHQIITLDGLSNLLNSALVTGGDDVPEGHYEEDNMKATVVPNRNKIFSSIIQAVALSIANKVNSKVEIVMGIHAGDHAIYPDCREEFRDADYKAFILGNWGASMVNLSTPYLFIDKFGILQKGLEACEKLGVPFNEVYRRTNTSYKPIFYQSSKLIAKNAKGKWYSDYKSASSVERIEAFIKIGIPDPVEYADETGPVSWEVAKQHVESVLKAHV